MKVRPPLSGINSRHSKLFPIFSESHGRVRVGYMDAQGQAIIEPRFSGGLEFVEGCAPVLGGKKWHYIDSSGEQAFPGEFSVAERISEGRAYAMLATRRFGYIDLDGRTIAHWKYRWAGHFSEGRALVYVGSDAGFIDMSGNEVIGPQYKAGLAFHEGLAAVQDKKSGRWGYINANGDVEIPFELALRYASPIQNGCASIRQPDGRVGFIDRKGSVVIEPRYRFAYGFTEGLAAVQADEGWGYIDTRGVFVIPPRFSHAYPFYEGLAAVAAREGSSEEEQIGFIERSGEFVLSPRFALGFRFHDGICWTETRETCGYIDRTGEYRWKCPKLQTDMVLRL